MDTSCPLGFECNTFLSRSKDQFESSSPSNLPFGLRSFSQCIQLGFSCSRQLRLFFRIRALEYLVSSIPLALRGHIQFQSSVQDPENSRHPEVELRHLSRQVLFLKQRDKMQKKLKSMSRALYQKCKSTHSRYL